MRIKFKEKILEVNNDLISEYSKEKTKRVF